MAFGERPCFPAQISADEVCAAGLPLQLKPSHLPKYRGINAAVNTSRARFYFWYYGFPMPLAEEGLRSF